MRRLAWNGIAFDVPDNWDLARYRCLARDRMLLVIEDEYSIRLEVDSAESRTQAKASRFTAGSTKALEALITRADRRTLIEDLPAGWSATLCEFSEILPTRRRDRKLGVVSHKLITAIYAPEDSLLRCVIRLNFLPGDTEEPEILLRNILSSFQWPDPTRGWVLWQALDLSQEIGASFRLETTTFVIGSKLMVFRRGGRRLYLWTLSCADRIFTPGLNEMEWVIGFLNGTRRVQGVMFKHGRSEDIAWRRRGLLALIHRDELARWCFRYTIGYRRLSERNQILVWVFNYRREADLAWLWTCV